MVQLRVDGEVRTEMNLPNYTIVSMGKCGGITEYIKTEAECEAAATYLGITSRRYGGSDARDDEYTTGKSNRPPGCYCRRCCRRCLRRE